MSAPSSPNINCVILLFFSQEGNLKKYLFLLFLLVVSGFFIINPIFSNKTSFVSPVNENHFSLNQWFPKQVLGISAGAPVISAKSAFFVETSSGEVLYEKNSHEKLPIASLVKVMTVLVSLEHKQMDDKFTVSQRASEVEPDEMILLPNEKLTLKELLYGIFLVSANDSAEVLAEGVTENRQEFIKLMNEKAKQLGMKDTFFANPTGLDEDSGNSFSSTYDLAILTRYLIKNYPEIINISETYHIYLPASDEHQDYEMYSGINLVTTYPGVVGFKTGYTPEAGMTLITLARKNGHEVIGVLLGSESRRDEAKELLDYSFGKL